MNKIFCYELRRTLLSRSFFGFLAVLLVLGWQTLTTETILGVAHTAPFSPWSFGAYMARLTPPLCLGLLFFLRNLGSPAARRLAALTDATPPRPVTLLLLRCGAAAVAAALLALAAAALGFGFLRQLFGAELSPAAALPALLAPVPALFFTLGVGLLAGRRPALLLGAAVALLVLELLPGACSLSGAAFYAGHPLTLGVPDPAFSASVPFLSARLVYLLAGCCMAALAVFRAPGRRQKTGAPPRP